jgi:GT2 family glycosyltransferase
MGIEATVEATEIVGVHRLRRRFSSYPLVSIIIPTAGSIGSVWGHRALMVDRCFESIQSSTSYPNYEIVCVVDEHWRGQDSVEHFMDRYESERVRFFSDSGSFNFSRKVNLGAFHARGDRIVLLNDDTEIITEDWLEAMLGVLNEGDVGAVGAALLHPDGTLQHGGQYMNRMPHHILYGFPFSEPGPMSCAHLERECSGVTAACEMVRRDVFEAVGGFCEELANNYNDVDFSLKVREMGMRVVWTPWARLWHHESTSRLAAARVNDSSRSNAVQAYEKEFIRVRWQETLVNDPYVSESLRVDFDTPIAYPQHR